MDFESWWLIFIPLLFGLGWMAARLDIGQILSETRNLPDSYFKGLNFLLNEEPDQAIDAFIEVAKLDPETTELHFALGSLFRRRGEMERAIRVHQSLLARADLPDSQREHAKHELAQDYLKAGMLDRAEEGFLQLDGSTYTLPALRALIRIYESEHDWLRAIEAAKKLRKVVDEPVPQLVHYYCEIAQSALQGNPANADAAQTALNAAQQAADNADKTGFPLSPYSAGVAASKVRIAMLKADIAAARQDAKAEHEARLSVLKQAPEFAGLVAKALQASFARLGKAEEGLDILSHHYQSHPSLDLFNVVFGGLRTQDGAQTAWAFARGALESNPSLLGLDRMLEIELAQINPTPKASATVEQGTVDTDLVPGPDFGLLRKLIKRHTQRLDRYACNMCGFQARQYYWQCPGCNSWETYRPLRLEEVQ